jgi:hypothetical protein
MAKDSEGKVSVFTDILIIIVATKTMVERFQGPSSYSGIVILAIISFLLLRSRFTFVQGLIRTGFSIVAVLLFLIDIFYSKGPKDTAGFLGLLVLMIMLYLVLRYVINLCMLK